MDSNWFPEPSAPTLQPTIGLAVICISSVTTLIRHRCNVDMLKAVLQHAIVTITDLPVTPGFESRSRSSWNGLDVQDGQGKVDVINVASGLSSSPIHIDGDE